MHYRIKTKDCRQKHSIQYITFKNKECKQYLNLELRIKEAIGFKAIKHNLSENCPKVTVPQTYQKTNEQKPHKQNTTTPPKKNKQKTPALIQACNALFHSPR